MILNFFELKSGNPVLNDHFQFTIEKIALFYETKTNRPKLWGLAHMRKNSLAQGH